MPVKRKTKADRLREQFGQMYKVGKAVTGLNDTDIAESLGIGITALWKRKNAPETFKFGEIVKLSVILRWGMSDLTDLIETMQ